MQDAICDSTVAMAAPLTPIFITKMNTGSSTILLTAPSTTDFIPTVANPWHMINWFMPAEIKAKAVPVRYQLMYWLA